MKILNVLQTIFGFLFKKYRVILTVFIDIVYTIVNKEENKEWREGKMLSTLKPTTRARELDRLFNQSISSREENNWYPNVELSEDNNYFYLKALMLGVSPENIDVEAKPSESLVTIKSWNYRGDKEETILRSEIPYGYFTRSIKFPVEFESENIQSHYENGLLLLTFPKKQTQSSNSIKISVNTS